MNIKKIKSPARLRAAARLMAASDPWRELGLTQKMCEATLRAPFRENYLAAVGRSFAGLITVTMYGTFKGYIQSLFVAESFRGRGIGEKLVAAAEARVFRVSPNVFLCVSSFNKGAIKFYRRLGYKKAGLLTDFVKRGHDELLMRKTRGPLLSYKAGKK